MSTENNELAALEMQAAQLDGETAALSPEAVMAAHAETEQFDLANENAKGVSMCLEMAVPILGELYPSLVAIYTPAACERVAGALGPLLAKYGIDLGEVGGRYKEEIGAAFICGPIAWATYKGIMADVAARKGPPAAQVVGGQQAAPVPVAGTLKPGDFGYKDPEDAARDAQRQNNDAAVLQPAGDLAGV